MTVPDMRMTVLLIAGLLVSCARHSANVPAPTVQDLRNARFGNVAAGHSNIGLSNGYWEASPTPGGTGGASVWLIERPFLQGDVDGDGVPEAVAFLGYATGGSGSYLFLSVVKRTGDSLSNPATLLIGDRVQIRGARLDSGTVRVELVQHGDRDAMCCPGDLVTRSWRWNGDALVELPAVVEGRLSLDVLGRDAWRLYAWNSRELVADSIGITLVYADETLTGRSGCNHYTAPFRLSSIPGDIRLGPVSGTRMACEEHLMEAEERFQRALTRVDQFGFLNGDLFLGYVENGMVSAMIFRRTTSTEGP